MSSDKDNNSLKTLLDTLQTLFSRVSTLNLTRRMMSHRKSDSALLDKQILSALYEVVEKTPLPCIFIFSRLGLHVHRTEAIVRRLPGNAVNA